VQNISYAPLVQTIERYAEGNGNGDPANKALLSDLLSLRDALKIQGTVASSHAAA
jgi:hypothetical protein